MVRTGRPKVITVELPSEALLIEMYVEQKMSAKQIAEEVGISEAYVRKLLHGYGIRHGRKHTPLDLEIVTDLYLNKGYQAKEIAQYFNTSILAVTSFISRHKLVRMRLGTPVSLTDHINDICVKYIRGRTVDTLAHMYNCSKTAIYKILWKHRVKCKRPTTLKKRYR